MAASRLERLASLSENQFRTQVVMPLLQQMGYERIRDVHGPDEDGKDIVCRYRTPLSTVNIAVVIKKGDLSNRKAAKRGTNRLSEVREQVHEAFTVPVEDTSEKTSIAINSVIVWVSGRIRSGVRRQVTRGLSSEFTNVEFKDGPETVDLLKMHYPKFWTIGDFNISTYFTRARKKYSQLQELLALGLQDSRRQLSSVFVEPKIELRERVRSKQAIKERLPRKRFQLSKLLENHPQNVALIGGMGTGKSAALRRLLLQIIEVNERGLKKFPIPVYVRFRDLDFQQADSILIGLQTEFQQLAPSGEANEFEALLNEGNVTVLLDGLDELETDENISLGIQELTRFVEKYRNPRVIFSSRSLEAFETSSVLSKFTVYHMRHLDYQQIQTLIRKWFENSDKDGEALIRLVSNPLTYTSLPHTPLTLALLAVVYDRGIQDLPANLTELIEKYVEIALGRWDMDKGIQQQIEWRIKQNLLGQLAWSLVQADEFSVSQSSIEDLVEAQRAEIGLTYDSKAIAREIIERSGLLIPRGDGQFVFKHHSFLSYFAGHELSLQPDSRELIVDRFYDYAWSRIIFFACGIKRDDRSFLASIAEDIVIPEENQLHFAMQLGLVTQASYLTPLSVKVDLLKRAIFTAVQAWDEIAGQLREVRQSEESSRHVGQFVLLDFITAHLCLGLGSPILRPALEAIVMEVLDKPTTVQDNISDVQKEWYLFFLAIACIEVEAVDSFVALMNAEIIRNPMLLTFCEFHAEFVHDVATLSSDSRAKLDEQVKKLAKRRRGLAKQINRLFDQAPDPILLPASTALSAEGTEAL